MFAVYHSPEGAPRGEGIVVCQPLGHEYFRCYRTLQVLCAELAQGGYHVLRFDFSNTGNSADADSLEFSTWVNDVARAVRELTEISGTRSLSLIGARLGATACLNLGSAVQPLKQIVLWDPVLDGASCLASLDRLHEKVCSAHPGGPSGAPELVSASGCERVGLDLPPGLRDSIGVITPPSLAVPAAERLTVVTTLGETESLSGAFAGTVAPNVVQVDSDCGWNDAVRFTEGLAPGEVMTALRAVFLA